ncbi:MAG TPA: serine/threonine-protein kinase, partial [Burkholderiales bacterium]|jgi:eukaryotic-like serine/threonine-protein kinase|nr:serine/threonine-protein kinase [Burkholderiales bacterium]
MKFELQEHIGKYPLLREIGAGATSKVYLARDPFAERDVAIKVFLFDKDADGEQERMKHKAFIAEASLAGKLAHPHIVEIFDAVVEPGRSYLVMEYVPGSTLEAHADMARLLPVNKVVEIIFKCIRALEYAHRHGVIHRDIKPGNILLSQTGETKVSDFGASFQQKLQDTTQINGVGSPAYMSPEQVRLEPLTHQTDIYSVGVTMYRLLTGRLPFTASTQPALTYAILNTPAQRPVMLRPELPGLLDAIVMKAMEKTPAARYQSWLDFGKDLSQAFASLRLTGAKASDSEKFTQLRDFAFFADFNDVALWELIRIATWKTIGPQTVLIREGESGDNFYFLVDGEVDVTLFGKLLATVKPGRCFGELLYFAERSQRRTSTITARTPITVMEVKADAMRAATDGCQSAFNKACMRVLIERLIDSNQRLAQAA